MPARWHRLPITTHARRQAAQKLWKEDFGLGQPTIQVRPHGGRRGIRTPDHLLVRQVL